MRQMDRSIHSPLQPLGAAQEEAVAPWSDLAPALHQPLEHEWPRTLTASLATSITPGMMMTFIGRR